MATGRPKGISTKKVLDFIAAAPDAPKLPDDGASKATAKTRKKDAARHDARHDNEASPARHRPGTANAATYDTWPYNVVRKKTSTLALTLPTTLLARLEAAAERQGVDMDALAEQLLERGLA